jgi:cystathionine gamma-synthase
MIVGAAIPESEHAVSVSLPTIKDVRGYEEGDPLIVSKLMIGYPRFKFNNYVVELMLILKNLYSCYKKQKFFSADSADCLVIPSAAVAIRFYMFLSVIFMNF